MHKGHDVTAHLRLTEQQVVKLHHSIHVTALLSWTEKQVEKSAVLGRLNISPR